MTVSKATVALTLIVVTVLAVRWNARHPFAIHSDENLYINYTIRDAQFLHRDGPLRLAKALVFEDTSRPPAMRVFALPLTIFAKPTVHRLRAIALVSMWLCVALVFAAARRLGGDLAGIAASMLVIATPVGLDSFTWFCSEYPLLLTTAAAYWALLRHVQDRDESLPLRVLFGASLGFCALSRMSFPLIIVPLLIAAIVLASRRFAITGALLGFAIAFPWWYWDGRNTIAYIASSRVFMRHSGTLLTSIATAIGVPLIIGAVVALVAMRKNATRVSKAIAIASAATVIATIGVVAASANVNPRFFAPMIVPLALCIAATSRVAIVIIICAVIQLATIAPRFAFRQWEQWDWSSLRRIAPHARTIAFLGYGHQFTEEAIRFPWLIEGGDVRVIRMWWAERRTIDWNEMMRDVAAADVVITAPRYHGYLADRHDLDNAHNAELAQRLGPPSTTLKMPDAQLYVYRRITTAARSSDRPSRADPSSSAGNSRAPARAYSPPARSR
jgi:hypothetical protein